MPAGDVLEANSEDPANTQASTSSGFHRRRWTYLQNSAKQPEIGNIVDDAMVAIFGSPEIGQLLLLQA